MCASFSACACVCTFVCVCVCASVCVCKPEENLRFHHQKCYKPPMRLGLPLTWCLPAKLDLLASEHLDALSLSLSYWDNRHTSRNQEFLCGF